MLENNPPQPPSPETVSEFIFKETQNEADFLNSEGGAHVQIKLGKRYGDELEYLIRQQFADSLEQNRGERRKYARWTFGLTVSWIFVVLLIVFLSGLTCNGERVLQLSDTVLITLITTTTVNVFAFFILVMQFLFNKEELAALSFLFSPPNNKRDETNKSEQDS